MPPKAPAPKSPTQLLWAHQLRREHGHLLDRIKGLEAEVKRVDASAKAATTAANEKITSIGENMVSMTQQESMNKAVEKIRLDVLNGLEDVLARIDAMSTRVRHVEEGVEAEKAERQLYAQNEKDIAERVSLMDQSLRECERRLGEMGEKADEGVIDIIRDQLGRIQEQVRKNEMDMTAFKDSLQVLDEVTDELKRRNDTLTREMKELASRPLTDHVPLVQTLYMPEQARSAQARAIMTEQMLDPGLPKQSRARGEVAVHRGANEPQSTVPSLSDTSMASAAASSGREKDSVIKFERRLMETVRWLEREEHESQADLAAISPTRGRRTSQQGKPTEAVQEPEVQAPQGCVMQTRAKKQAIRVKKEAIGTAQETSIAARTTRGLYQARPQPQYQTAIRAANTDSTKQTVRAGLSRNTKALKTQAPAVRAPKPKGEVTQIQAPAIQFPTAETQGATVYDNKGRPVRAARRKAEKAIQSQLTVIRVKKEPEQSQAPVASKRKAGVRNDPEQTQAPATKKRKIAVKNEPGPIPDPMIARNAAPTCTRTQAPRKTAVKKTAVSGPEKKKARRDLADIFSSPVVSWQEPGELEQAELPELPADAISHFEGQRHVKGCRELPQFTSEDSENARALAPYL